MSEELTPMNHRELWLQAIATGTVPEWLEPMTHEELWLKAIAQSGGSGGGGEPLILHTTSTPISGGTRVELDKTAGEIYTALMSGKQIFLLGPSLQGASLYPLSMIEVNNAGFVTNLFNKTVVNAEFQASTATTKPYYTTSGGGND